MARQLDEIIKALDPAYDPGRQLINQKIAALPGQAESEIKGLEAQQGQAFDTILAGARSRGMGFSGIPIAEQAKYTSSEFLPAVARVRQTQTGAQSSLTEALNNSNMDQRKSAMSLWQQELDRDEQARQFNEQMAAQERATRAAAAAASAASFNPTLGGLDVSPGTGALPAADQSARPSLDSIFAAGQPKQPMRKGFSAPLGRNVWFDQNNQPMTPAEVAAYENNRARQAQKDSNRLAVARTSPLYYGVKAGSSLLKSLKGIF